VEKNIAEIQLPHEDEKNTDLVGPRGMETAYSIIYIV